MAFDAQRLPYANEADPPICASRIVKQACRNVSSR